MKYLSACICFMVFISCTGKKENKETQKDEAPIAVVKTVPIAKGGITVSSKLPAQLAAYQEVSIFPKVNGYVKDVLVDIGSKVSKNQLLMTLDDPELQQSALSAKSDYDKAESDYDINKENYNRLMEASKTEGAVSAMDLALNKAKVSSSMALMNAAKAAWQQQETLIDYLQVRAPFAGVITARNVHPGALVSNSVKDVPILELKQESHLRLQIDAPEDIASDLRIGDSVTFIIPSLDNKIMHGAISRISNNVNPQFRSERIELDVHNDGTLNSGMYVDVYIRIRPLPNVYHVPLSAVHGSAEDKYINIRKNNQEVKVPVSIYRQSTDSIEIRGAFNTGDSVEVS